MNYLINVTGIRTAEVTDLTTNRVYNVKVEPYHRIDKKTGNSFVCRQVRLDNVLGATAKSKVIQVPRILDPITNKLKLLVKFESDLTGKASTSSFAEEFN